VKTLVPFYLASFYFLSPNIFILDVTLTPGLNSLILHRRDVGKQLFTQNAQCTYLEFGEEFRPNFTIIDQKATFLRETKI
jgi:hypothetical protein